MLTTFGAMGRPGYAGGGLVSRGMFVAPKNLIETVQRSIQDSISSDINESIADLRTRIGGMVSLPSLFDRSASAAATMKTQKKQTGYGSVPGNFNIVQYITGDPSQGANYDLYGHGTRDNYHDHIAFATEADKEKAKAALRAAGIQIGSEFRFGDPGYHGSNLAIDIPGSQWGGTGAIGQKEYDGSAKVRQILGLFGGGKEVQTPMARTYFELHGVYPYKEVKKLVEEMVQTNVITPYQQEQVSFQKEQVDIQKQMRDLLKMQSEPEDEEKTDEKPEDTSKS